MALPGFKRLNEVSVLRPKGMIERPADKYTLPFALAFRDTSRDC